MIDWGSVPLWVGSSGTGISALVAAFSYSGKIRGDAREQAGQVVAERNYAEATVTVINLSESPIRNVEISVKILSGFPPTSRIMPANMDVVEALNDPTLQQEFKSARDHKTFLRATLSKGERETYKDLSVRYGYVYIFFVDSRGRGWKYNVDKMHFQRRRMWYRRKIISDIFQNAWNIGKAYSEAGNRKALTQIKDLNDVSMEARRNRSAKKDEVTSAQAPEDSAH